MKFVGYERKRKESENRTHMGEVEEILLSRGGGGNLRREEQPHDPRRQTFVEYRRTEQRQNQVVCVLASQSDDPISTSIYVGALAPRQLVLHRCPICKRGKAIPPTTTSSRQSRLLMTL